MCGQCKDGDSGCQCPGSRMERFIQPCLLLLLKEGAAHGYALLSQLPEIGWREMADPGAVYRTLRRMNDQMLVESQWETGGPGPARRLYRITSDGEALLEAWADNIKDNITILVGFLDRLKTVMEPKEVVDMGCDKKACCEQPDKLKGKPDQCSPEQIKECHGDEADHSCCEQ